MVRLLAPQSVGIPYCSNTVSERFPDLQRAAENIFIHTAVDDSGHRSDSPWNYPLLGGNLWRDVIARRRRIAFSVRTRNPFDFGGWLSICLGPWRSSRGGIPALISIAHDSSAGTIP